MDKIKNIILKIGGVLVFIFSLGLISDRKAEAKYKAIKDREDEVEDQEEKMREQFEEIVEKDKKKSNKEIADETDDLLDSLNNDKSDN